jgi:hypothetical protein
MVRDCTTRPEGYPQVREYILRPDLLQFREFILRSASSSSGHLRFILMLESTSSGRIFRAKKLTKMSGSTSSWQKVQHLVRVYIILVQRVHP